MDAYFYANHNGQRFDSSNQRGWQLVGQLELPAGDYVVTAKADIGVNAGGGYPDPAYPHGGDALGLALGGAEDVGYAPVRPESGSNIQNIPVMVAAQTRTRDARACISSIPIRCRRWSTRCGSPRSGPMR